MFRRLQMQHLRRDHNGKADVLASLKTSLTHLKNDYLAVHIRERRV